MLRSEAFFSVIERWVDRSNVWTVVLICGLLSLMMRTHHLDKEFAGYHGWRQTQTQTTVLNFAYEDGNIFNPNHNTIRNGTTIERMEFPLMQWLFSWPYRWFGDLPIISRVLTFLLSLVTLSAFYRSVFALGRNRTVAAIGTWCLTFSPLFYYYSINPLPDNMALMFAMLGLATVVEGGSALLSILVAGVFFAFATAVKLPFIVLATVLLPRMWSLFRSSQSKGLLAPALLLLVFAPPLAWYAWVIPTWGGNMVLTGGWDDPQKTWEILHSVWTMMLPEMILNYASVPFFVVGTVWFLRKKLYRRKELWPVLVTVPFVVAYYVFELHAIGKGHDYYMYPFVPIFFLAVALGAHLMWTHGGRWRRWIWLPVVVLPITCFLKADTRWGPTGIIRPLWEHAEGLRNVIPPESRCVVGNDVSQRIFLYYMRRKGWAFDNDMLPEEWLIGYMDQGAEYLISNSPAVESDQRLQPYLGEVVYAGDGIRAFRLVHPE